MTSKLLMQGLMERLFGKHGMARRVTIPRHVRKWLDRQRSAEARRLYEKGKTKKKRRKGKKAARYRRVGEEDRLQMEALIGVGLSVRQIADELGFDRSTVYRELKRNMSKRGYRHVHAQNQADRRVRAKASARRKFTETMWEKAKEKVRDGWTFEQFGDRITATKSALEMSNRVWIVCGELIVQSGGKIDADARGYGEPSTVFSRTNRGYGPGRGTSTGLGGTHGGYGRYTANANVMAPYGAVDDPRTPGSSGGTSTDNWCSGYAHAGGGAILIEAEGQVTVEGTITAAGDYGNNDSNNHADGSGSGGSINVRAARFVSAAGQLVACGGSGNAPGGGGRIAILVDSEKQRDDDATAFTVNVAEGSYYTAVRGNFYTSVARPGSFWSNDLRLYRNFGTSKLAATVYPPDADDDTFTWNGDLTVTNVHTRIPDSVKTFIVTGSVVAGGKSRFAFGAATAGGSSVSESVRFVSDFGVPFEFRVGGDFRVSAEAKGAPQFEFTAAADYNYAQGGVLSVAGTLDLQGIVGQTSTVYLTCSPDRGNAFVLRARDMVIGAEAKIDADGRGYAQGAALSGTGIGMCDIYANSAAAAAVAIGSGHGGAGSGATSALGFANDSSVWPRYPGASGGRRYDGDISNGGGYIHLAAERNLTLSGVLTACGNGALARSFASAGGTVLLEAKRFSATATAQILARGGDHTGNGTGSGGGGIVSVFSSPVPYAERKSDRSVCELAASSLFAEGAVVDVRGGTIVSGDRAGEGCFHCWTVKNAGFMLIVR